VTDDQTSTVRGDAELIARAGHLFDAVHEDFVCAARDLATWSQPEARSAVARRCRPPARTASRCASCGARWCWPTRRQRAHLRRLSAAGAQVRISSAPLPHETIILDRRVAILAGQPSPLGREFTVTTSPVLVGGVYSLFTAAWEAATDLGAYLRGEVPELGTRGPGDPAGARGRPHRRGGRPAAWHPRCAPTGGGSPS